MIFLYIWAAGYLIIYPLILEEIHGKNKSHSQFRFLCLPMHVTLSSATVDHVVAHILLACQFAKGMPLCHMLLEQISIKGKKEKEIEKVEKCKETEKQITCHSMEGGGTIFTHSNTYSILLNLG